MMTPKRPALLNTGFTPGTHDDLLASLRSHLDHGHHILHVVTANPEYVMFARADCAFADAMAEAGMVTVDGAGLALATRLLHPQVLSERYTGVTLTSDLAMISSSTGAGLFLLGAAPGVALQTATCLEQAWPGVVVSDVWGNGTPAPEHDAESIQRITASGAKILLVAYGAPAQIHWIQRNMAALDSAGVRVVAGIGGAFDYLSGNTPLPPRLVRKLGMEWLYRLVREPWRWRRQMVLPHFAVLVLGEFARKKMKRGVE